MIYADRKNPLKAFIDFKNVKKPSKWDELVSDKQLYKDTRSALLNAQNGMSAYTEMPLDPNGIIHIDHFKKKGMNEFKGLMFEWSNLIVDQKGTDYGADYKDRHINNANQYRLLINPAAENPEMYFSYLANGSIVHSPGLGNNDSEKADYSIGIFNLNHPYLVKKRRDLIKYIEDYKNVGLDSLDIKNALISSGFRTVIEYAINVL